MWEEYWTWVRRYRLLHECTLRGSDGFFTRDEGPRGQQDTSSTFSISVVDLKKEKKEKKKEVSWWSETQTEDRKRAWVLFWKGHLRIPSFLPSTGFISAHHSRSSLISQLIDK